MSGYLPDSHQGRWAGPNRLWMEDPGKPERSEGEVSVEPDSLTYTWSFGGEPQTGSIRLRGPEAAVHALWTDTFHAAGGMDLYGSIVHGVARLTGTYPAGEDIEWGWLVELDFRDPERFLLRMFNVQPGEAPVIAVDLHGLRTT